MEEKFQIDHKYDLLIAQLNAYHQVKGFSFEPNEMQFVYAALVKSIARFLAKNKLKDKRVSIVINDESNNFIFGMAIDYEAPENEEDEMPGNWELVGSFDSSKILNDKKIVTYNLQDNSFLDGLRAILLKVYNVTIERDALRVLMIIYFSALLETLKQGSNNENGSAYTLPVGDMNVSGQIEDSEFVSAVELQGTVKSIAKDDTSLEDINI